MTVTKYTEPDELARTSTGTGSAEELVDPRLLLAVPGGAETVQQPEQRMIQQVYRRANVCRLAMAASGVVERPACVAT